jgi:hypothetical protein
MHPVWRQAYKKTPQPHSTRPQKFQTTMVYELSNKKTNKILNFSYNLLHILS